MTIVAQIRACDGYIGKVAQSEVEVSLTEEMDEEGMAFESKSPRQVGRINQTQMHSPVDPSCLPV